METFSEKEVELINQLIQEIHLSTGLKEMSEAVMRLLPGLIPHEKSFFSHSYNGREDLATRSLTMTDKELSAYTELYKEDDYTAWHLNRKDVIVYRDSDLISEEMYESSVIYNEWVRPMEMRYICGNVVRNGDERLADLTLFRRQEHGDFTDRELFILQMITEQEVVWFKRVNLHAYQIVKMDEKNRTESLTERELEVMKLACSQLNLREIAEILSVSYSTVRKHLANIYMKLGINSRAQLMNYNTVAGDKKGK